MTEWDAGDALDNLGDPNPGITPNRKEWTCGFMGELKTCPFVAVNGSFVKAVPRDPY